MPTCMLAFFTADPIIIRSSRCSRPLRERCGRPAGATGGWLVCCPARRGCCRKSARLRYAVIRFAEYYDATTLSFRAERGICFLPAQRTADSSRQNPALGMTKEEVSGIRQQRILGRFWAGPIL